MDGIARLTFGNGDQIITGYSKDVSREEMARYYLGRRFNLGNMGDDMNLCVRVEFINSSGKFGTEE